MVATVALQLVDEGKLSLTDKLSKFFPLYPKADLVTMLLTMTSGIYNYALDSTFEPTPASTPTKVLTPKELVDMAFRHPYDFTPGTANTYTNTNYILLGLIIEKVTCSRLKTEIDKRLLRKIFLVIK
jgi:D-alanyl-D-alanine carboxypeptidase